MSQDLFLLLYTVDMFAQASMSRNGLRPFRRSHLARDAATLAAWEALGFNQQDMAAFLSNQEQALVNKNNIALDVRIRWVLE